MLKTLASQVKEYKKASIDVYKRQAGSVGKPKTNKPDANYVIIEICDTNVEVEIIEVSYNFEKMAKEIEENEILPNDFARLIREGSAK